MIERLLWGYTVKEISRNLELSRRFAGFQKQYSSKNLQTSLIQGNKDFWCFLTRLDHFSETESTSDINSVEFSNGILNVLFPKDLDKDGEIEEPIQPQIQNIGGPQRHMMFGPQYINSHQQQIAAQQRQTSKQEAQLNTTKERIGNLGIETYKSAVRDKVVTFCGWVSQENQNDTASQNNRRQTDSDQQQTSLNAEIYARVKREEKDVKGGRMRAVVMAALHFDFSQASTLSNSSESVRLFNEDPTTMQHLLNLLKQLREITKP